MPGRAGPSAPPPASRRGRAGAAARAGAAGAWTGLYKGALVGSRRTVERVHPDPRRPSPLRPRGPAEPEGRTWFVLFRFAVSSQTDRAGSSAGGGIPAPAAPRAPAAVGQPTRYASV